MRLVTLCLAVLSVWATLVSADSLIESSALLTCMDNSEFTASTFDVTFFPGNKSVTLEISAISTIQTNVSVTIEVIVYGITVVTEKVDPCSITALQQQFCPMTSGHLDLSTNLELSDSIVGEIPGIAYTVPNLDAQVKVIVYQKGTTTAIACVEATLSNGKTVQTKWASWGMGLVCLFGILTAGCAAIAGYTSTSAHIASNVVSLFIYFQSTAVISMMAVKRLPPIAAAWAQNFQWTMGIMRVGFMQSIFSWYVQSTGGTSLNLLPNKNTLSIEVQKRDLSGIVPEFGNYLSDEHHSLVKRELYRRMIEVPHLLARASSNSSDSTNNDIVTTNEADPNLRSKTLLLRGMQRVAYLADVELSNLFLTGLTFFVILAFFSIVFMILLKLSLELLAKTGVIQQNRCTDFRQTWSFYCKGFLFRLTSIAFLQLSVLCLYELTRHDSAATVVLALVSYLVVVGILGFASYKVISTARKSTTVYKNPAYILYSDVEILNRWGFLYVQFRATAYYFLVPSFAYSFCKAAFIAFGQAEGRAQAIGIFLIELAFLVLLAWKKPYMDKPTNGFNIGISVINFINSIFFLFFSQLFGQPTSVSSIIGVVFFVLNAVFSLVLLILILVSIVWFLLSRNPDNRYQPMRDDRDAFMKDTGNEKGAHTTELDALGQTAVGDKYQAEQFRRSMMAADDEEESSRIPTTNQFLQPNDGRYQNLEHDRPSNEFPRTHFTREEYGHDPFGNEYDINNSSSSVQTPHRGTSPTVFPPAAATSYKGYYPTGSQENLYNQRQPPQW